MNIGFGWLATGERGLSSEAMFSRFTGICVNTRGDYPHDPGDFRRCERLLREVPIFRLQLSEMKDVSAEWSILVDHWDELVALAESEVPGCFGAQVDRRARAPLTYARMNELLNQARRAVLP